MNLWYMRDNHTFRELPLDVEQAMEVVREEFARGWSGGMLCADGGPPPKPMTIDPNAHARAEFAEFEPRARIWLAAALSYKSPGDLEYQSWAAAAARPEAVDEKRTDRIGAEGWKRLAESQQAFIESDRRIKEITERYGLHGAASPEPSGETMDQREEVCAAWADLPDDLRKDSRLTRLYRALGGPRMDDPTEAALDVLASNGGRDGQA